MNFSSRIRELRRKKGYSQQDFAEAFGVGQSTVANWETGNRETDFQTLQKLADFFDVSVDYLIGRTKYKHGEILEGEKLPKELQGLDIKIEVIREVADSGLTEKQIKRALKLYKLYTGDSNDNQK